MAKKFSYMAIYFLIVCGLSSCEKSRGKDEIKNVTLNVTINAGSIYQLDLRQYGDPDDIVSITTQALNFSTSEIVKDTYLGKYTYTFMRAALTKTLNNGTDKVIIKVAEPSGRRHHEETNITVNFTIL